VSLSPFSLRTTPDHVLLADLQRLAASHAELEAELLVHLGEVDARKLHLAQGFSSLFAYCLEVLHFSESVAFQRIGAARAARAFPLILERVRSGELHLSGLRLLVPHLTQANHVELLDRARHRSKRAIEEMLADRAPKPDAPAAVRRMIQPAAAPAALEFPAATPSPAAESVARRPMPCPAPCRPEAERPSSEPLGESRYRIQFTSGPAAYAKLCQAQALLRHQIPDGDLARLFERALDALLREARRTKFAETSSPRAKRADVEVSLGPESRHIPAAIRRAVVARDGERCTFVAHGRRCAARDALEFHHVVPFARSKRHRVQEIELRCRAHNGYAASQDFGAEHMARFRRERASTATGPGASRGPDEPRAPASTREAPHGGQPDPSVLRE
jgi:5-methylcytosine-specific restriction endonuclease McrA